MHEYAISRAYADARAERIAGGSSEVMKEIVARTLWPRTGSHPTANQNGRPAERQVKNDKRFRNNATVFTSVANHAGRAFLQVRLNMNGYLLLFGLRV